MWSYAFADLPLIFPVQLAVFIQVFQTLITDAEGAVSLLVLIKRQVINFFLCGEQAIGDITELAVRPFT